MNIRSKISTKIVLATLIPVLILITIILTYMLVSFRSSLEEESTKAAMYEVEALAKYLDGKNLEAVNTAKTMATMQETGGFGKRALSLEFARTILTKYPQFQGAYFGYEPNADGLDENQEEGKCCTNGRFIPYYYRANGEIALDPLVDMDSSLYYQGNKEQWNKLSQSNPENHEFWMITEPYIYEGSPIVEQSYPIIMEGKFVGIAGVDRSLDALFSQIREFKPFNTSKTFLISRLNKFITTTYNNDKMSMKQMKDFSGYEKIILPHRNSAKPGVIESVDPDTKEATFLAYAPVHTGEWFVVMTVEKSEILASANETFRNALLISVVMLLITVLVIVSSIRSIAIKPLKSTTNILQTITKEKDLRKRLDVFSKDEIGQMSHGFNNLLVSFQDILKGVIGNSETLAGSSEGLAAVATQLTTGSTEMLTQSTTVAGTTDQMSTNINTIATAAEEMSVNIAGVSSTAEQMSVNMNSIAGSIDELNVAVQEISRSADIGKQSATESKVKSSQASQTMNALGDAAKGIGEVTDVIKRIAEQTNLLALNATIEAASAGDAGKGFAVVANEIKELASQSAQAAEDIARRIDGVQAQTNETIQAIESVTNTINKNDEAASNSAKATSELNRATKEIANNIMEANSGIRNIATSIAEVAKGAMDMSKNSGEAAKGSSDVASGIVVVSQNAQASNEGAQQVNESAINLSMVAADLYKNVNQFQV